MSKSATSWGRWTFDRETLELVLGNDEYRIDLERCNSSAEVLDWICQLAGKSERWVTGEDLGNMVRALDDLLRPQAHICCFGCDATVPVTRERLVTNEQQVLAWREYDRKGHPERAGYFLAAEDLRELDDVA